MKTTALLVVGGLLVFAAFAVQLHAADANAQPSAADFAKAMEEAGKPGPEHAKLKPLEGTWIYTCKLWMDPSQPPVETTGTIERKWILGGRFLEENFKGKGFDGKTDFEGRGLVGYDNAQKKYTTTWVCSMGTGICTGSGEFTGDKLTFNTEAYCPVMKKMIKGRDEMRIESNDRTVAESYINNDGQEFKMMEIVAVRKK
jgi:Protein of unknown function (DUF1579)